MFLAFLAVAVAKDCTTGKACGETCIEKDDVCHVTTSAIQPYYDSSNRDVGPSVVPAYWDAYEKARAQAYVRSPLGNPYTYIDPRVGDALAAQAAAHQTFGALLQAANRAMDALDYRAAIDLYDAALSGAPTLLSDDDRIDIVGAFLNEGICQQRLGDANAGIISIAGAPCVGRGLQGWHVALGPVAHG